jgi:hypothetical protein
VATVLLSVGNTPQTSYTTQSWRQIKTTMRAVVLLLIVAMASAAVPVNVMVRLLLSLSHVSMTAPQPTAAAAPVLSSGQ